MAPVLAVVLRLFLLAAGLVFALSLAAAFLVVLALWSLRVLWGRLSGRPVAPFATRFHPGQGFGAVYRRAQSTSRTPRADAVPAVRGNGDVTDVDPK